jgi:hypothetical protein
MNQDFKPINCSRCGALIWTGVSWAGFTRRLDTPRLTIEEEIIKRLSYLMTYELHRTRVSFEAVERSHNRIRWARSDRDHVIVADHTCQGFRLFESEPPKYWKELSTVLSTGQEPAF